MAGRIFVCKEGLFLRSCHHGLQSVSSEKEEENQHERARLGGLVGEHRIKRYADLPVVGLVPARTWDGRWPVLGMVARKFLARPTCVGCQFSLLSGSRHVAMPRGRRPLWCVCGYSDTLKKQSKKHLPSLLVRQHIIETKGPLCHAGPAFEL